MRCQTCRLHQRNCCHVQILQDILNDEAHLLSLGIKEAMKEGSVYPDTVKEAVSTEPVLFHIPLPDRVRYGTAVPNLHKEKDGVFLLYPTPKEQCDCGRPLSLTPQKDTHLYTRCHVYKVKGHQLTCTMCPKTHNYDGGCDFILNMGTYMVHHEVLRDYVYHFLNSSTTMYNFLEVYNTHLRDAGTQDSLQMSYRKLRDAVIAFLQLLSADFSWGFKCPICQDNFNEVVMDGTSLGYQQRYGLKERLVPGQTVMNSGSSHRTRTLIPEPDLRKLLQRYSADGLLPGEHREMMSQSAKSAPFLLPLLQKLALTSPTHANRGLYTTDTCKKEASDCRKTAGRHPNLIPGIFTLFCTHGPKTVIYDNACQLLLAKGPRFF
ncbi:uncharacterized protein LOC124488912 isoform X2 [Hypomesus transpacificus]|uniref:uncharacterized protein LOC124488912 isoform X2 n=1 Tax=Hypomesus transpacificus TaxID=137520 RepID=UPI001F080927|nr:uncharacterized protein LOC124488912 isoform X2 [Hypomesus transpacificus]